MHERREARRDGHSNCQQFWGIRDDLEPTTRARGCVERNCKSRQAIPFQRNVSSRANIILLSVRDPSRGEEEILLSIIQLDITKIRQYLKGLRAAKGVFEEPITAVESRILTASSYIAPSGPQQFLEWFGNILAVRDLPLDPEPEVLVDHIRWTQKAKRYYVDFLKAAFSTEAQPLPRWVRTIFKLGRYGVASRALVQLASELPALVNPMTVEPVIAPPPPPPESAI